MTADDDDSTIGQFIRHQRELQELTMRQLADLGARVASDSEASYVSALEAQEDWIVEAFRDATAGDQPARVRELAATYLPEVEQMHDSLRSLKQAVAG